MAKGFVNANPTKAFFTDMLTRDIELQDAILDLLDNCVDGIVRHTPKAKLASTKPYQTFRADINFDGSAFSISDNCGGIDKSTALKYAFRFGHDADRDSDKPTVGVYGIGMKRAIFKMGKSAIITSQYQAAKSLVVKVPANWITTAKWEFPYEDTGKKLDKTGTVIRISDLHPKIADVFSGRTAFENGLVVAIGRYYGQIIAKGFTVTVNDTPVKASDFKLLLDRGDATNAGPKITPFVVQGKLYDVSFDIVCGFYAPIKSDADDDDDMKRSAENSGWSVACNDRIVVYNDKEELTGWGMRRAGTPRFHQQFVGFAGIVNFRSDNVAALPMQTTKRGVDANAPIYMTVREFMMEGIRIFTKFTTDWKGDKRVKAVFKNAESVSIGTILKTATMRQVPQQPAIKRSPISLPPKLTTNPARRISFLKPEKQVLLIADFFDEPDATPSAVGEFCFDYVLEEAKK